jgi:hypothetical protein
MARARTQTFSTPARGLAFWLLEGMRWSGAFAMQLW